MKVFKKQSFLRLLKPKMYDTTCIEYHPDRLRWVGCFPRVTCNWEHQLIVVPSSAEENALLSFNVEPLNINSSIIRAGHSLNTSHTFFFLARRLASQKSVLLFSSRINLLGTKLDVGFFQLCLFEAFVMAACEIIEGKSKLFDKKTGRQLNASEILTTSSVETRLFWNHLIRYNVENIRFKFADERR